VTVGAEAGSPHLPLVVGMDVGGTSSRAVVADLTGRVVGSGRAGGGNPTSRGVGPAMAAVRAALEEALQGVDRTAVRGNVVGAAGFGAPGARPALGEIWRELGLPGAPVVVGDTEVAFASGTPDLDGSVLISGTGAIASEFVGGRPGRVADGIGWLLGDHGSGFWVGREAVRRALAPNPSPDDPLAGEVAQRLTGRSEPDRQAIITAAYELEPVRISELSLLVVELADQGSAAAADILRSAADELLTTLSQVRDEGDDNVVVLGGGVLLTARVRVAVEQRVQDRWPGAPVTQCGSAVGGAAWLAARNLGVDLPPDLHARLTSPAGPTRPG
jgi:glucosamine kinase